MMYLSGSTTLNPDERDRAVKYANERGVFDRHVGRNQGVQRRCLIEVEFANLMRFEAARLFDQVAPR